MKLFSSRLCAGNYYDNFPSGRFHILLLILIWQYTILQYKHYSLRSLQLSILGNFRKFLPHGTFLKFSRVQLLVITSISTVDVIYSCYKNVYFIDFNLIIYGKLLTSHVLRILWYNFILHLIIFYSSVMISHYFFFNKHITLKRVDLGWPELSLPRSRRFINEGRRV